MGVDKRPWAILAIAWLLFLVVVYPGLVTLDSLDQLAEARAGFYTDSHPPVMSALWRVVDMVWPGTFGMIVLQTATFVVGLYLVLARCLRPAVAAGCAAFVLWFPPVAAPMAVAWKDSMMAGTCMLGIALLLREGRRVQLAGLGLLALGAAFRHNGAALALPPIVLLFRWSSEHRPRVRYPLAVVTALVVALAGFGANRVLTDQPMHFWSASAAVMDIAGTLCYDDRHYTDEELRALFAGTDLRAEHDIEAKLCGQFRRTTSALLVDADTGLWHTHTSGTTPTPAHRRDAIVRTWREVVPSHPVPYAKYRLSVYARVIGLFKDPWGLMTPQRGVVFDNRPELARSLGIAPSDSAIQATWIAAQTWIAEATPLFWPWVWIAILFVLLAVVRRRDVAALALSGLAVQGTLLLLATTPDFRYSHWTITCAVLALAILLGQARMPRRCVSRAIW